MELFQQSENAACQLLQGRRRYFKEKNYKRPKLTDQILKIVEQDIEKIARQQININEIYFGFTSGAATADAIFIVKESYKKSSKPKRWDL